MENDVDRKQLLRQVIRESEVGMLTTIDEEGRLVSRPMLPLLFDNDQAVYFLTHASSAKVRQISNQPRVALTFTAPQSRYLSVTGRAAVIDDAGLIARLWNPTYRAWFPDGADDAEATAIQITIEQANYWEAPTSRVARLIGMIEAIVTHTPYDTPKTRLT